MYMYKGKDIRCISQYFAWAKSIRILLFGYCTSCVELILSLVLGIDFVCIEIQN